MLDPNITRVGYDTTFELDEFKRPRLRSESETIKNLVLFILFSKPGCYPSIPHIGLNIKTLLYSHYDEIRESDIEDQVIHQCNAMGNFFENGNIRIRKVQWKGKPSLIIRVTTDTYDSSVNVMMDYANERDENTFLIGITLDEFNDLIYNINDGRVENGSQ